MKALKKMLVSLMAVAVLAMGVSEAAFAAAPAAPSVKKTAMSSTKVTVENSTVKYNGKNQTAKVVVTDSKGNVLKEGVDYEISGTTFKHSGVYTITVTGKGYYDGTATAEFTIKGTAKKSQNKVTAKAKKTSVKAKSLKKKSQKIKISVKKAKAFKGKVEYKVVKYPKNAKKYISVSKKGVVTLKKGAKKGTYKVKVSVAGYKKYNPMTKTVTIKVK